MNNLINKIFINHSFLYKMVLYVSAIALVVYLFPKGGQFKYEFQKGKPWQYENYYAPFDFAIKKTQDEIDNEVREIEENAKLFFEYDESLVNEIEQAIIQKAENVLVGSSLNTFQKSTLRESYKSIVENIYKDGFIDESNLNKVTKDIITLRKGNTIREVRSGKLLTEEGIFDFISSQIGERPYTQEQDALLNILYESVKPNVYYDEEYTQINLDEALAGISYTKGLVSENERIIFKGDIVEGDKLQKLNSLKSEFESQVWSESNYNWIVLGYTILVALAFLMLFLFLRKYRFEIYENNTKVTFIFFNIVLIVLMVTLIVKYDAQYVYIAPVVIMPLVLKAFFDARLGLFSYVLTVLLLGFIVPNSFEFNFLQIIAGIVTILTISELYKRSNLFISVLQITGVYFISYFAFSIIQEGNAQNLNWEKFVYFALNGTATLFVMPLIYVFEKMFGLVSDESLKELSNTNSKLLRKLAEEAPGTFQHSLQVANLAEACAIEINANAMLVRTGALYHDIGKLVNPFYFTENQSTSVNPHDELTPKDSARIIINHILDGVELAKKNRLPDRIIDFIRTHHGTTLVYYFYKKEEEFSGGDVKLKDFQYPGPIPFSKETAILMMCDAVEAATKSIKDPDAQNIDDMVERVVNKQMDDGQFMNANITFKEMKLIKKVLQKKLKNIYQLRIEYPE